MPVRSDEVNNVPSVKFRGRQRGGTERVGTLALQPGAVSYDVTMTASAAGIDTPFVTMVMVSPGVTITNNSTVPAPVPTVRGSRLLMTFP